MVGLPIDSSIPEIVARVRESRSLVLVAPPGAGKTTRVPPALLAAGLVSPEHPNLVMLQPRRVAARASAQRIAEEQAWTLGREVGYHVRFEKKVGPDTRLRVLTEGILTRQLLDDPFLEGVGCVILDEFHERSIHTDVCAALLREVRQTVRDDLILVIMSATLDAEPVARFLGNCPVVRTEGRTFPVEVEYAGWSQDRVSDRAAEAVGRVLAAPDGRGDVLVFLPGAEEIRRTMGLLGGIAGRDDLKLLPLHGSLPFEEQVRALRPADKRKVILATNIAETSLTIEGVRTVVDSGLARVAGYDPRRGLDRLELQRISKASAAQRAGRAGRTGPGRCLRLWSQAEERAMPDFLTAEVHRVDLCGTVLMLHAWGKPDPRAFGWYEPPPEEMLASAERLLAMLGALTGERNGQITPLGRKIMSLPVHPRLARLLLAAAGAGMAEEGAAVAALLSEKDMVYEDRQTPPWAREAKTQGASDLLVRLDLLGRAEAARFAGHLRDEGIDVTAARQVAKTRDELLRVARQIATSARRRLAPPSPGAPGEGRGEGSVANEKATAVFRQNPHPNPLPEYRERGPEDTPSDEELLLKLPLLAYPDRVCRRRGSDPTAATMVGGGGVKLAAESIVRQPEFFLALDARQDERSRTREALVRVASQVRVEWLEELFPHEIRREQAAVFDPQRGRVVGVTRTWYRDLLLREATGAAVDPDAGAAALAAAVRPRLAEFFAADEAASKILARVDLLRRHMPEHPWPALDEETLSDLLVEASRGKRSLDELRGAPLASLLQSRLPHPLDRLLEQHAPDAIEVPTGNRIRLTYAAGQAPVLAVRLQEIFGWTDTPRIAAGRLPVVLHLLGPNYRPVQITDDLRSFWSTTYFQVRKDLRTRYPKHSWPEDPLSAKPEAKGGRRRG